MKNRKKKMKKSKMMDNKLKNKKYVYLLFQ